MILHHLGYACEDIGNAIKYFCEFYEIKNIGDMIFDELQNVYLCLLETKDNSRIELVSGNSVKKYLKEKISFYHTCYEVEDLFAVSSSYKNKGAIEVVPPIPAKLFDGRLVTFLQTEAGLIELLESQKKESSKSVSKVTNEKIIICSTFTSVFVQKGVRYLANVLNLANNVELAPYNQVFQQLLDPTSIVRKNEHGYNVLLLRLEDWVKGSQANNNLKETLAYNINELVRVFKIIENKFSIPYIICFCPPSYNKNSKLFKLLIKAEKEIIDRTSILNGIYFIFSEEICNQYKIPIVHDSFTDKVGHIPYTQSFEMGISLVVMRKINSIIQEPYKVIVVDCDQTLWSGVCGEVGSMGIKLTPSRLALQKFLLQQRDLGLLLCICSKNNECDIKEVFNNRDDLLLKKEHITEWCVNWEPKSKNLIVLAEILGLTLSSFIFIDDNPLECAEVKANCPQVLTLQLPSDEYKILTFLQSQWAFDKHKVSKVDKNRQRLYIQHIQRNKEESNHPSLKNFIDSLNLKIGIVKLKANDVARVAELSQRTNQFNTTTIRMSEINIGNLKKNDCATYVVSASDRFGDYGLVGFFYFHIEKEILVVDNMLLSCRALGKGVEHAMLLKLGAIAKQKRTHQIKIIFSRTDVNKPAEQFLRSLKNVKSENKGKEIYFYVKTEQAIKIKFSPCDESYVASMKGVKNTKGKIFPQNEKLIEIANLSSNLNLFIERVLGDRSILTQPTNGNKFLLNGNEIELLLINIWKEVLCLTTINTTDDFIDLGGNSLLALQILSRIFQKTSLKLPIKEIFDQRNIKSLTLVIDNLIKNKRQQKIDISIKLMPKLIKNQLIPASYNQQSLWFLDRLATTSHHYNMPIALKMFGILDIDALKRAFEDVVERHQSLRTHFKNINGILHQVVVDKYNLPFSVEKIKHISTEGLIKLVEEEVKTPFCLTDNLLFRIRVIQISKRNHLLLLTLHHMIFDGWSHTILYRELSIFYNYHRTGKGHTLKPLPVQYLDYSNWHNQLLTSEVTKKELMYWEKLLENAPSLQLRTDFARPDKNIYQGKYIHFEINNKISKNLSELAKKSRTSIFTIYLSIFYILIARFADQHDFVIGIPVAGRTNPDFEGLIGYFTNILALRLSNGDDPTFLQLVERNGYLVSQALENQNVPFGMVVEKLGLKREVNRNPLFQVLFAYHDIETTKPNLSDLTIVPFRDGYDAARFDLTFELEKKEKSLMGGIYYSSTLFSEKTIHAVIDAFKTLINKIVSKPQIRLSHYTLMSNQSQENIIRQWSTSDYKPRKNLMLHKLFEKQVKVQPNTVSVKFAKDKLTYQELDNHADSLISYLQGRGLKKGARVAVATGRCLELIISIIACFKGGFVYIPLDPDYPQERLKYIADDAGISVILTQTKHFAFFTDFKALTIDLKKNIPLVVHNKAKEQHEEISLSDSAYIFYTSGTTGKPKGVSISHFNIVNLFESTKSLYVFNQNDNILLFHSYAFDVSLWEIFSALSYGASLIIPSKEEIYSPDKFYHLLVEEEITVLNETPSAFNQLVFYEQSLNQNRLKSLRLVILAGEALKPRDLQVWFERHSDQSPKIFNMYGITETTVYSTYIQVTQEMVKNSKSIIGCGIPGVHLYILDKNLQPVPANVTGEIYIGGHGVGMGYINQPELTQEKFLNNPFSKSICARLYKTGDLARYLNDGNIEYIGRIDHQIKLRGYRIELDEVEAVLMQHDSVAKALAHIQTENQDGKNAVLVVYVIPKRQLNSGDLTKTLQSLLENKLPYYMIPKIVFLDHIPLTINGKVNREALPKITNQSYNNTYFNKPKTTLEIELSEIWQEILGKEVKDIDINFFDMGGNSLLIMQLFSKITKIFSYNLTVIDLFNYPTIRKLANYLDSNNSSFENPAIESNKDQIDINTNAVAVIGLGGKFPGGDTIEQYWENIKNGVDCISRFSKNELFDLEVDKSLINHKDYIGASGIIKDIDKFDANFFDLSPEEASITDPQQRIFLEIAWSALEDAGYTSTKYDGAISVYAGMGDSEYLYSLKENKKFNGTQSSALRASLANEKDFLATKVAYKLGLTGPALNVNTACSTSLVAVVKACQSLVFGESDIAIAGGVSLILPSNIGYLYEEGSIFSTDGVCRAFDKTSSGTVPGSGVGVVILKRLADAIKDRDHIYATLEGYAINNDGNNKVGFSAPSQHGQSDCIRKAWKMAKLDPEQICYVEAHGTGTSIGDPIEVSALIDIFEEKTKKQEFCAIGSVKNNIGHAQSAAGIAGLIKAIFILNERLIPPHINYTAHNDKIKFSESPFYVNKEQKKITTHIDEKIFATVSSFGMGGTNSHVVLKNYNDEKHRSQYLEEYKVIPLSGKTPEALESYRKMMLNFLRSKHVGNNIYPGYLDDVAYTLQVGRTNFNYRRTWICKNIEDALEKLSVSDQDFKPNSSNSAELDELVKRWISGDKVDWKIIPHKGRFRVPLPTYPFIKQRYWNENLLEIKTSIGKELESVVNHTSDKVQNLSDVQIRDKILTIIKESLGYSELKLTSNFHDLGGDSLVAIGIVARIEEELGFKTTPDDIFSAKDIEFFVQRLIKPPPDILCSDYIVNLKSGINNNTPIFFIHPGNGSLFHYQIFLMNLEVPNPIWGIENPIFANSYKPFVSIEAMAGYYVKKIQQLQPQGPYFLVGWSFGGVVAFEIAKQFELIGEKVSNITLIDSWAKYSNNLRNEVYFKNIYAKDFYEFDDNKKLFLLNLLRNRFELLLNYCPQPIKSDITLFKATIIDEQFIQVADPLNHWGNFSTKNIEVVSVRGNHWTIMDAPHVVDITTIYKTIVSRY